MYIACHTIPCTHALCVYIVHYILPCMHPFQTAYLLLSSESLSQNLSLTMRKEFAEVAQVRVGLKYE